MEVKTSNLPIDLIDVTKLATRFFVETYFTKRMQNRIELVTVAFRKFSNEDMATACPVDDYTRRLPTEFVVEFNNMYRDIPVREYLITLMHEMTHVKQYCAGDLKSTHLKMIWKGEVFDDEKISYWDHPWEREAMSIEYGAYSKFMDKHPELNLERFTPTYSGRSLTDWYKKKPQ